jgi:hypothetical protein
MSEQQNEPRIDEYQIKLDNGYLKISIPFSISIDEVSDVAHTFNGILNQIRRRAKTVAATPKELPEQEVDCRG